MTRLPISILIIAEGYEEEAYLKRVLQFSCFNKEKYVFSVKNANGSGNIAPKYQDEYSRNKYDLIFVFCDGDNNSKNFKQIVKNICEELFDNYSLKEDIIIFVNPVTLQIVLSHFGDVELRHISKKKNAKDVELLTGVKNYDAKKEQVNAIVGKIHLNSFENMMERIEKLSTNIDDTPSTNFGKIIKNYQKENIDWAEELISKINNKNYNNS